MEKAASIKDLLANTKVKSVAVMRCAFCKWLVTLDPEDADAIQSAIYSGEWQLTVLAETLKPVGLELEVEGLRHHARQKHQITAS